MKKLKSNGSDLYQQDDKLITKNDSPENHPIKKTEIFFYKAPLTVFLLTLFTFSLYSLYWAYKHWQAINMSTGKKTYPVLSAIFQLFTAYPLFKQIRDNAIDHGDKKFKKAGYFATSYVLLLFALNLVLHFEPEKEIEAVELIALIIILTAGVAVILSVVQRAANVHNIAVLGKKHEFQKVFKGEIVFTIIGATIMALVILGFFSTVTLGTNSKETNNEISVLEAKMNLLRQQHETCSSALEAGQASVDVNNDDETDTFNSAVDSCEHTRMQLNAVIDEYNRSAGYQ